MGLLRMREFVEIARSCDRDRQRLQHGVPAALRAAFGHETGQVQRCNSILPVRSPIVCSSERTPHGAHGELHSGGYWQPAPLAEGKSREDPGHDP